MYTNVERKHIYNMRKFINKNTKTMYVRREKTLACSIFHSLVCVSRCIAYVWCVYVCVYVNYDAFDFCVFGICVCGICVLGICLFGICVFGICVFGICVFGICVYLCVWFLSVWYLCV